MSDNTYVHALRLVLAAANHSCVVDGGRTTAHDFCAVVDEIYADHDAAGVLQCLASMVADEKMARIGPTAATMAALNEAQAAVIAEVEAQLLRALDDTGDEAETDPPEPNFDGLSDDATVIMFVGAMNGYRTHWRTKDFLAALMPWCPDMTVERFRAAMAELIESGRCQPFRLIKGGTPRLLPPPTL